MGDVVDLGSYGMLNVVQCVVSCAMFFAEQLISVLRSFHRISIDSSGSSLFCFVFRGLFVVAVGFLL